MQSLIEHDVNTLAFEILDIVRRAQGIVYANAGFGPQECDYSVIHATPRWRLRTYEGDQKGPPILIVAAPFKQPYIWDLTPSVSPVRYCLTRGFRVFLLEWAPPSPDGDAGLADYADEPIGQSIAHIREAAGGEKPFLVGHSMGGTFAAIHCALDPRAAQGLVLLGAPLSFQRGSSVFRDAITKLPAAALTDTNILAGSFLSQASAMASPNAFIWSRMRDALYSAGDPLAMQIHQRVERWTLDEMPLSGRLIREVWQWLYYEDRFCRGVLEIRGRKLGPADVAIPVLAVANDPDEIAPLQSVLPFLQAMRHRNYRTITYPGESGVALRHVCVLAGRQALKEIWPQIVEWVTESAQL